MKTDKRTSKRRTKDLTLSTIDNGLELLIYKIDDMQRSAIFNNEYKHAGNYQQLKDAIQEIRLLQ